MITRCCSRTSLFKCNAASTRMLVMTKAEVTHQVQTARIKKISTSSPTATAISFKSSRSSSLH